MARRTHRVDPRKTSKSIASKAELKRIASKAEPGIISASKARKPVGDQYGHNDAASGFRSASKARDPVGDQYGHNDTTQPESTELGQRPPPRTRHEGDQYGRHGAIPPRTPRPPLHRKSNADRGPPSGSDPTEGRGRHRANHSYSEEAFIADAAAARRTRLRYEALIETDGTGKTPASETDQNYKIPEAEDEEGSPSPSIRSAASAAERVRSILSPASDQTRRLIAASERRSKKGNWKDGQPRTLAPRGEERNTKRLRDANASDRETLGESPNLTRSFRDHNHLPDDASLFFSEPATGPCDEFNPPVWFLEAIQRICATPSEVPTKSPIRFEISESASAHNAELLRTVDFDLGRLILKYGSSTLGFGSEFRKVSELRPLIGRHPHFHRLETLLTEGMQYVFDRELSLKEMSDEVDTMMARGNHKSAQSERERVGELLAKDVTHGFTIPLPIAVVKLIPGAMVQPLGLVQQWTVDHDGARKAKFRLTQDLSFSTDRKSTPKAINARVDMSAYVEMVYGWCLPRIINFIVALRSQNPTTLILISKYDYSDAYRRIAHSASAAAQTIAINGETAFLSLRLTFGGSPNPPTWCMFSELVTDLANEIGQCDEWDPTVCRSPAQPSTPKPTRLPTSIPIVQARQMAIHIPPTKAGGRVDGFIDDLINVFLDTPANCLRQPNIVPLAMHLTSRPHAGDEEEPIPRRPILSIPKLIAEGRPEEVQIVLGWQLNTRLLEISLPDDKFRAWSADVRNLRIAGHCPAKELETLVGRLNHTAYIIPNSRHFMSRIRRGLEVGEGGKRHRKVGAEALKDLLLWEGFLTHANRGVSMNLLVTREPNKICWSDACPYGLGGYSISGRAWRLRIPRTSPIFGNQGINNLLEFLGMAINIWLACLESLGEEHCILAIGDNTSAIGWLHNSSRLDTKWNAHKAHLQVARKIAQLLIDFRCCIASQHLKGELNVVADLLSFAGDGSRGKDHPIAADMPANDELTRRFLVHYPSQVPASFAISQLPDEILSWTTQVLRVAESYLTEDKRAATSRTTEPGGDGSVTVCTSGTVLTPFSLCYPTESGTSSLEPFSISIEPPSGTQGADLRGIVANQWSRVLCAKPQATWLRRFGAISGSAPCTSKDLRTCALSLDPGSRPATMATPRSESKRPRLPNSCEQCSNSRELDPSPQTIQAKQSYLR